MAGNEFDLHFEPPPRRLYDGSVCFLCGGALAKLGSSSEHVIPRWAQLRFDLWNQRLTLLNGTTIPYRQLTIPCCDDCNRYRLQPIETIVASAVSNGHEAVRALGNRILFLWLGKIFYGILYKELLLAADRRLPALGSIFSAEEIQKYEMHLHFLQEARGKLETVDFCPGSIFVFQTQKPAEVARQWDLIDNIDTMFLGIRMGEVGFISSLADGGAQGIDRFVFDDFTDLPLHPVQFRELCSLSAYRATLATRNPSYVTIEGSPAKAYQVPLGGFSLKPLFVGWNDEVFAHYLAGYTGLALEEVYPAPGQVATFLYGPDRRPRYIPYVDG
jgi:hypothetical protein